MTTQMNATYINALLADASYVELTNANGDVVPETEITSKLKDRLTQPLAEFITDNTPDDTPDHHATQLDTHG